MCSCHRLSSTTTYGKGKQQHLTFSQTPEEVLSYHRDGVQLLVSSLPLLVAIPHLLRRLWLGLMVLWSGILNGRGGAAWVARFPGIPTTTSHAQRFLASSAIHTEARACLLALTWARHSNALSHILIYIDLAMLVCLLQSPTARDHVDTTYDTWHSIYGWFLRLVSYR